MKTSEVKWRRQEGDKEREEIDDNGDDDARKKWSSLRTLIYASDNGIEQNRTQRNGAYKVSENIGKLLLSSLLLLL